MANQPRMLSIGAAVQDVFLTSKVFIPVSDGQQSYNEFPLGSKLEVDGVTFSTGGGAMNAAVTFARHGLDSAFMGVIGHDPAGQAVLADLDRENVDAALVEHSDSLNTGYSVILLAPGGERTVLVYRGASAKYDMADFNLDNAQADWIYMSSFAGQIDIVEQIVTVAARKGIKIAWNPGKDELEHADKVRALLEDVTLLSLNKEEMSLLVEGSTTEELARHAAHYVDYVIVTDGPRGEVAVGDGKVVVGGMYEDVSVIDRTGAGDAFSSGFAAMIASGKDLQHAVTFAAANSTSVVSQIGAKAGILPHDAAVHDMDLKVKDL